MLIEEGEYKTLVLPLFLAIIKSQKGNTMIEQHIRPKCQKYFDILGVHITKFPVTANQMTLCAFLFGVMSAVSIGYEYTYYALIFLWLSGLCDVLDGTIARLTNTSHPFGAYTDLIADRMVECGLMVGFAIRYPEHYMTYIFFLIALLFHFSTFVVAGSVFDNNGPKSMHHDRSIVERAEAFVVFSFMILYPQAIYYILMPFTIIVILSGCARFMRVKSACDE